MLLSLLAAGGLVALSSCSVPDPRITFFSSGRSVSAAPIQYCDVQDQHCNANGSAAVSLTVVPGQPVQISVPQEVANTPWQVAARFKDANGTDYAACSPLFKVGQQFAYTVYAPHAGDQLVLIEIYQSSGTITMTASGDIYTPVRGTWVLTANTQGAPSNTVLPKPADNLCSQ